MDCLNIGADHVHSLTSNKTKLPSNYIEILKRKSPTQTKKKQTLRTVIEVVIGSMTA